jgi:proton-coupled amino acid transporter
MPHYPSGRHAAGSVGEAIVDVSIVLSQTGFCCAYLIFITENLATFALQKHVWLLILLPPLFLLTLYRHLDRLALFR